jgi:hypothetical protein
MEKDEILYKPSYWERLTFEFLQVWDMWCGDISCNLLSITFMKTSNICL